MSDSEFANKSLQNALQLIRDEATKPLHAEIERLLARGLEEKRAADAYACECNELRADLADAEALLDECLGYASPELAVRIHALLARRGDGR